jgi:hypothetical protein
VKDEARLSSASARFSASEVRKTKPAAIVPKDFTVKETKVEDPAMLS